MSRARYASDCIRLYPTVRPASRGRSARVLPTAPARLPALRDEVSAGAHPCRSVSRCVSRSVAPTDLARDDVRFIATAPAPHASARRLPVRLPFAAGESPVVETARAQRAPGVERSRAAGTQPGVESRLSPRAVGQVLPLGLPSLPGACSAKDAVRRGQVGTRDAPPGACPSQDLVPFLLFGVNWRGNHFLNPSQVAC